MDCPLSRMSPHLLAQLQAPPTPEDLVHDAHAPPEMGLEELADDFLDGYSLMGACGRGCSGAGCTERDQSWPRGSDSVGLA